MAPITTSQSEAPSPSGGANDIRVQKLSHIVADRLRSQIVSGSRKAGERLPPEAELILQFKVSRPILREALRILEVESLISLGRGARTGALILAPSVERVAAYASMVLVSGGTTMADLHEARMLVEPSMVAFLARENKQQIAIELQEQIDIANEALRAGDYVKALACVNEFHTALFKASGNRTLLVLVEIVNLLLRRTGDVLLEQSGGEQRALSKNMLKTTACYQELVRMIKEGRDLEAAEYWRRYMDQAHEFLGRTGLGLRKLSHPEEG